MLILCFISVLYIGKETISETLSERAEKIKEIPCVVIDAGHGKIEGRPKEFGSDRG